LPISNALKVYFANFAFAIKVSIFKLLSALLAASIALLFAISSIRELDSQGAFNAFGGLGRATSLQNGFIHASEALGSLWSAVRADSSLLAAAILSVIGFFLLLFFLTSLDEIAQGEVIYARLSANCRVSYAGSFLKRLVLSLKFAIFKMVYIVAVATIILLILFSMLPLLDITGFVGIISPFLMIFVFAVLIAAVNAFSGGHVAAILTSNDGIFISFFKAAKKSMRCFFRLFLLNVLLLAMAMFISYVAANVFNGILLFITIPATYALYSIFNFVCFLDVSGSRYYADTHTIITPKKSEHYDKVKDLIDKI